MALERLLRCPTLFLSKESQNYAADLLTTLKSQYDNLKDFETKKRSKAPVKTATVRPITSTNTLPSLLVNGFDQEQIWQQIELQNKTFRRTFRTGGDAASTSRVAEPISSDDEDNEEEDREQVEEDDKMDEDGEDEEVDDEDDGDDGDEEEMNEEEEMDVDGDSAGPKSSFEQHQKKLQKRIEEYEEQILSDKPWQLSGEVTGTRRPENSLLEEHVSYEHATKLPPVITQETTESLESLIIQRIRDQAWDDVERKIKPVTAPYVYKNELVLDQEKPKMSLSQLYEQEFLKKTSTIEEEKKNPKHEDIRKSMKDLFFKLDLLTSCHYTPKPLMPELKVVNNMPSIQMEEVAPISVSDGAMLAPEEVKEKLKGEMKAKEERSKVDKNRELRSKKKKQKLRAAKMEQKEKDSTKLGKTPKDKMKLLRKVGRVRRPATGHPSTNARGPTTSKDFFSQLQAQAKETVAKGKNVESKKRKDATKKTGATFKT